MLLVVLRGYIMATTTVTSQRRATSAKTEQIPRDETISLRNKHVGPSCKLFFKQDPLKIVRAKGKSFNMVYHIVILYTMP